MKKIASINLKKFSSLSKKEHRKLMNWLHQVAKELEESPKNLDDNYKCNLYL